MVIVAGGKAKRLGVSDVPKALLKVGNKTLLDLCVEMYKECGYRDFVLLLGHLHERVEEHLEKVGNYGVNVKISVDPEPGNVGKGKALKYALVRGAIDRSKRAIITYPDDVFLDRMLPIKLLIEHMHAVESYGVWASLVFVPGIEYPYGIAQTSYNGVIEKFEEKPFIEHVTYTGTCMVEPRVFDIIDEIVDLNYPGAVDFEGLVIPKLAKEKKLYCVRIPPYTWIPVNTLKDYERVLEKFRNEVRR